MTYIPGGLALPAFPTSPFTGQLLPNAAQATAWHQAIGRVMSGAGDATLLCEGDSILAGLFTNQIGPGPTIELERVLAGALGIPVTDGLAIPTAGSLAGPDNRWAAGAGWTQGSAFFPGNSWGGVTAAGGQTIWNGAAAAGGSLVFQPRVGTPNGDNMDVYSIGGSFSVNFQLGTDTVLGSLSGLQKTTVSGASTSRPLCTVHAPTGLGCFIIGVDTRLSTTPTLRVGNASTTSSSTGGGATAAGWTNTSGAAGSQPQQCVSFYNPDVVLVNISEPNDLGQGLTTAQTIANWTTILNVARACKGGAGGAVFSSQNPCNPNTAPTATQAAYWAACAAFCAANRVPYIDLFSNLNGASNGFAVLAAMNPSYYGDGNSIHPGTNPGMPDYGRMLGEGLALL